MFDYIKYSHYLLYLNLETDRYNNFCLPNHLIALKLILPNNLVYYDKIISYKF